jgi:hypothetical protein
VEFSGEEKEIMKRVLGYRKEVLYYFEIAFPR